MPRKKVQVNEPKANEAKIVEAPSVEPVNEVQSSTPNKDEYLKARMVIKSYREAQKTKPKRQCSEKQLEALAKGRAVNKRFANKKSSDSTN